MCPIEKVTLWADHHGLNAVTFTNVTFYNNCHFCSQMLPPPRSQMSPCPVHKCYPCSQLFVNKRDNCERGGITFIEKVTLVNVTNAAIQSQRGCCEMYSFCLNWESNQRPQVQGPGTLSAKQSFHPRISLKKYTRNGIRKTVGTNHSSAADVQRSSVRRYEIFKTFHTCLCCREWGTLSAILINQPSGTLSCITLVSYQML